MKVLLPINITIVLFDFLEQRISMADFEQWLYQTEKLENLLSPDDYLTLLTLNFKSQDAKADLNSKHEAKKAISNIINRYANIAKYRNYELTKLLNDFLKRKENLAKILAKMYKLYCDGYSFLDILGLKYGVNFSCYYLEDLERYPYHYYFPSTFTKADIEQAIQQEVENILPEVDIEIEKVLSKLNNREIRLDNHFCQINHFDY